MIAMSFLSVEDHMWFAGSMEREKAEQFLMEVSVNLATCFGSVYI